MKRIVKWIRIITFIITMIAFGIEGVKLLEHNYDFLIEAYIVAAGFLILVACSIYQVFSNICPYCGKRCEINGTYCPHCGRKIENNVE